MTLYYVRYAMETWNKTIKHNQFWGGFNSQLHCGLTLNSWKAWAEFTDELRTDLSCISLLVCSSAGVRRVLAALSPATGVNIATSALITSPSALSRKVE